MNELDKVHNTDAIMYDPNIINITKTPYTNVKLEPSNTKHMNQIQTVPSEKCNIMLPNSNTLQSSSIGKQHDHFSKYDHQHEIYKKIIPNSKSHMEEVSFTDKANNIGSNNNNNNNNNNSIDSIPNFDCINVNIKDKPNKPLSHIELANKKFLPNNIISTNSNIINNKQTVNLKSGYDDDNLSVHCEYDKNHQVNDCFDKLTKIKFKSLFESKENLNLEDEISSTNKNLYNNLEKQHLQLRQNNTNINNDTENDKQDHSNHQYYNIGSIPSTRKLLSKQLSFMNSEKKIDIAVNSNQSNGRHNTYINTTKGDNDNNTLDIFKSREGNDKNNMINPNSVLAKCANSVLWIVFLELLTIYVLFIDDIRIIILPPDTDIIIDTLLFISIGFFFLDIIFIWIIQKDYRWSFFFFVDIISTITVPINTQMFQIYIEHGNVLGDSSQIARACRVMKTGISAARIVRFIKLIGPLRFSKPKITKKIDKTTTNTNTITPNARIKQAKTKKFINLDHSANIDPSKVNDITRNVTRKNTGRRLVLYDDNNAKDNKPLDKLYELQRSLGVDQQHLYLNEMPIGVDETPIEGEEAHIEAIQGYYGPKKPAQIGNLENSVSFKDNSNLSLIATRNKQLDLESLNNPISNNNNNTAKEDDKKAKHIGMESRKSLNDKTTELKSKFQRAVSKLNTHILNANKSPDQNQLQRKQTFMDKSKTLKSHEKSYETRQIDKGSQAKLVFLTKYLMKFKNENAYNTKSLSYLQHINPRLQSLFKLESTKSLKGKSQALKKSKTIIPGEIQNDNPNKPYIKQITNKIMNNQSNNSIEGSDNDDEIDDNPHDDDNEDQNSNMDYDDLANKEHEKARSTENSMLLVEELPKESRVGRTLYKSIIKSVIIIVLLVLFIGSILDPSIWQQVNSSYEYDLILLDQMYVISYQYNTSTNITNLNTTTDSINNTDNPSSEYILLLNEFINDYTTIPTSPISLLSNPNTHGYSLLKLIDNINNITLYDTLDTLSPSSSSSVHSDSYTIRSTEEIIINQQYLMGVFSARLYNDAQALLDISRTFFICFIMIIHTVLIHKDTRKEVIIPLERMIQKVNYLANSHLISGKLALLQEDHSDDQDEYNFDGQKIIKETLILEDAIIKIVTLLSLGFGEAGSHIITQNIKQDYDVEPFISGHKVLAIFGFCDIRNFTDVTEILEQDVMVFVNTIANIVHNICDKYLGQPNKNIGDAFLLVWKFPITEIQIDEQGNYSLSRSDIIVNIADLSIITFLTVIAKVYTSPVLKKYRENPKILQRMPNYQVKMGFGLDQGWAIEGAIGSEYKIDASYLSPHVNLSSRMEAATKQYGVPLLFTQNLYNLLSEDIKRICRKIDIITVKGSKIPIEIYTIDLKLEKLNRSPNKRRSTKKGTNIHNMGKRYSNNSDEINNQSPDSFINRSLEKSYGVSRRSDQHHKTSIDTQIGAAAAIYSYSPESKSPIDEINYSFETQKPKIKTQSTNHKAIAYNNHRSSTTIITCIQCNKTNPTSSNNNAACSLCERRLTNIEFDIPNGNNSQKEEIFMLNRVQNDENEYEKVNEIKMSKKMIDNEVMEQESNKMDREKGKNQENMTKKAWLRKRFAKKIELFEEIMQGKDKAAKYMNGKKDLKRIILINQEFTEIWDKIMSAYISGNWSLAERLLSRAMKIRPNDGPSQTLFHFIKTTNFIAPDDWPGYRELVEK